MKKLVSRPGYFGRRRDEKVALYDKMYGKGKWRLVWANEAAGLHGFNAACRYFYERSYYEFLLEHPEDVDFICSFGECIDNAPTNVDSGMDYSKQESFSTHIQDIAVRNAIHLLGRKFEGPMDKILVIRTKDDNGYRFGPGNIPFYEPQNIISPSLCPAWAGKGSVEDFWQSNKWIEADVRTEEGAD